MNKSILSTVLTAILLFISQSSHAVLNEGINEFTDEATFLAELNNLQNVSTLTETFEPIQDGVVTEWADALSTISNPAQVTSATHHDVTWSRPTTDGEGTLRTGDLAGTAHTVPGVAMINSDGFFGLRIQPAGYRLQANGFSLIAVGGWLKASTISEPVFVLDRTAGETIDVPVDLLAPNVADFSPISSTWAFRGVIDLAGFSRVDIVDVEGIPPGDEVNPFFSDDFYLATLGTILDSDFDEDGDVDGDDFLAWQTGFGVTTGASHSDGDADGDGDVDGDDFLLWQSEFGGANGGGAGMAEGSAVPEPATAILLVMAVVVVSIMKRQGLAVIALAAIGGVSLVLAGTETEAAVERYKIEAEYFDRLAELGFNSVSEGFESSTWDEARSPDLVRHSLPEVLSQGLLWEPASKDLFGSYSQRVHGLTTNHNWAKSGEWGVFEDHAGDLGYPTSIRVSSITPMYSIGGWFNTNPDGQSVGFLFEDRTTANDPGYYLPGFGAMYPGDNPAFGHEFIGIVDPDGFNSVVLTGTLEVNEEGILEGGTIYGADDFTIAVIAVLDADFDTDGDVDGDDFLAWQTGFGTQSGAQKSDGDYDNDGDVDGDDFLGWQVEFGSGGGSANVAVPEPASIVLLFVLTATSVFFRVARIG